MAGFIGIDVGTSGCKALLVDEKGKALRFASAEYPLSTPKPGWSEQDPEDWWNGVQDCLRQLGEKNPIAIGLTGQMHGSVFLDKAGAVVRTAILWNDQRTVAECEEIERLVGAERVRAITCNPPLTGFQLPKILWLKNHEPDNFSQVAKVLLPKDYIRFKLSGEFATDVSDASGTGALDVPGRKWSAEIPRALDLDPALFPNVLESSMTAGVVRGSDWLGDGIPIVAGGGDQAAAAVGTGAVESGIVSISLGTSGVVFTAIPQPEYDPAGAVHTFCHANRGWHAMGVMLSCGGALRWLRATVGYGRTYSEISDEAALAPVGCDGLTFLPYLTGERSPHNDPLAKASWSGLTLAHGFNHLARSVFEGATFGLMDCYEALQKLGAECQEIRVTGGGARSPFWLQMIADVFGRPVTTLSVDEGPAYGAAILAGVGAGVWKSVEEACKACISVERQFVPTGASYAEPCEKYRQLYVQLKSWNVG